MTTNCENTSFCALDNSKSCRANLTTLSTQLAFTENDLMTLIDNRLHGNLLNKFKRKSSLKKQPHPTSKDIEAFFDAHNSLTSSVKTQINTLNSTLNNLYLCLQADKSENDSLWEHLSKLTTRPRPKVPKLQKFTRKDSRDSQPLALPEIHVKNEDLEKIEKFEKFEKYEKYEKYEKFEKDKLENFGCPKPRRSFAPDLGKRSRPDELNDLFDFTGQEFLSERDLERAMNDEEELGSQNSFQDPFD